jgi:hypothetical protein
VQPLLLWKSKIITYSESVLVALDTQHEMRVRRIVIYGFPGFAVFVHIIS